MVRLIWPDKTSGQFAKMKCDAFGFIPTFGSNSGGEQNHSGWFLSFFPTESGSQAT
jgi:hypothetical protein